MKDAPLSDVSTFAKDIGLHVEVLMLKKRDRHAKSTDAFMRWYGSHWSNKHILYLYEHDFDEEAPERIVFIVYLLQ